MDACAVHYRVDLATSLPSDSRHVRFRLRASREEEAAMDDRFAVRHQSGGECDLHADSVRDAESAISGGGHSRCLGDNHLDVDGRLEALQMGCRGAGSVFRVGIACDGATTEHHLEQLGAMNNSHKNGRDQYRFNVVRRCILIWLVLIVPEIVHASFEQFYWCRWLVSSDQIKSAYSLGR